MASKVSFTIRRPSPVSRAESSGPDSDAASFNPPRRSSPSPLAHQRQEPDSSDEDSVVEDELVTGFDQFGVQRLDGKKKQVEKALVIPALRNKDWRELARKRRTGNQYVPPSGSAQVGKDGSVGGLGTKDTINSGPVLSGLQIRQGTAPALQDVTADAEDVDMQIPVEETEDQIAIRAILAEATGQIQQDGPMIDMIPKPVSETDALKQDVEELPEAATMDDYARVPVEQFGAALLRGMGWKEGTAATRKPGKGLIEPYLPTARPALLGIGAKEQEVLDDGKKKSAHRPDRRYVPIVKQERGGSGTSTPHESSRRDRSRSPRRSHRRSRSPEHYSDRREDSSRRYDDRTSKRDRDRGDSGVDRDRRREDSRGQDRQRKQIYDEGYSKHSSSARSDRKRDRSRDSRRRRD